MTTNTCTCHSIRENSQGQSYSYHMLGVLCPTCESAAEEAARVLDVWHPSKDGKLGIHLRERGSGADPRNDVYPALPKRYEVSALYTGTHETAPYTRHFDTERQARKYANELWA